MKFHKFHTVDKARKTQSKQKQKKKRSKDLHIVSVFGYQEEENKPRKKKKTKEEAKAHTHRQKNTVMSTDDIWWLFASVDCFLLLPRILCDSVSTFATDISWLLDESCLLLLFLHIELISESFSEWFILFGSNLHTTDAKQHTEKKYAKKSRQDELQRSTYKKKR
jgi:hypothetical protein